MVKKVIFEKDLLIHVTWTKKCWRLSLTFVTTHCNVSSNYQLRASIQNKLAYENSSLISIEVRERCGSEYASWLGGVVPSFLLQKITVIHSVW